MSKWYFIQRLWDFDTAFCEIMSIGNFKFKFFDLNKQQETFLIKTYEKNTKQFFTDWTEMPSLDKPCLRSFTIVWILLVFLSRPSSCPPLSSYIIRMYIHCIIIGSQGRLYRSSLIIVHLLVFQQQSCWGNEVVKAKGSDHFAEVHIQSPNNQSTILQDTFFILQAVFS